MVKEKFTVDEQVLIEEYLTDLHCMGLTDREQEKRYYSKMLGNTILGCSKTLREIYDNLDKEVEVPNDNEYNVFEVYNNPNETEILLAKEGLWIRDCATKTLKICYFTTDFTLKQKDIELLEDALLTETLENVTILPIFVMWLLANISITATSISDIVFTNSK